MIPAKGEVAVPDLGAFLGATKNMIVEFPRYPPRSNLALVTLRAETTWHITP